MSENTTPIWTKERREELLNTARETAQKAVSENRDLTPEEQKSIDDSLAEAKTIGEKLAAARKSAETLAALDAMAPARRTAAKTCRRSHSASISSNTECPV